MTRENYYTTKTLLTPWFDKWGPMQQIKKKIIKTNQESKHSKAKTIISLQHKIIKCNTKKIYLTIFFFYLIFFYHNVLDNNWEVVASIK